MISANNIYFFSFKLKATVAPRITWARLRLAQHCFCNGSDNKKNNGCQSHTMKTKRDENMYEIDVPIKLHIHSYLSTKLFIPLSLKSLHKLLVHGPHFSN